MKRRAVLALVGVLAAARAASGGSLPCSDGVSLELSNLSPRQGSLVIVEVKSARPLAALRATGAGETLHFWEDRGVHRALLGIDLTLAAKPTPLAVEGQLLGGRSFGCTASVSVEDGKFKVERIQVAARYVDLNPKDLARSQEENRKLARVYAKVSSERQWRGAFRLPVAFAKGNGSFGKRRVLNGQSRSPHGGEDFPSAAGTPVSAPGRGRVVLAEDLFFSGNTVILDHGLALFTLYAHLESISVKVGAVVDAGAPLGRVGATGRVTGPHLHWAARLGKARVDPLSLLALP